MKQSLEFAEITWEKIDSQVGEKVKGIKRVYKLKFTLPRRKYYFFGKLIKKTIKEEIRVYWKPYKEVYSCPESLDYSSRGPHKYSFFKEPLWLELMFDFHDFNKDWDTNIVIKQKVKDVVLLNGLEENLDIIHDLPI